MLILFMGNTVVLTNLPHETKIKCNYVFQWLKAADEQAPDRQIEYGRLLYAKSYQKTEEHGSHIFRECSVIKIEMLVKKGIKNGVIFK